MYVCVCIKFGDGSCHILKLNSFVYVYKSTIRHRVKSTCRYCNLHVREYTLYVLSNFVYIVSKVYGRLMILIFLDEIHFI